MKAYTLNQTGQAAVTEFVDRVARDGVNSKAFFWEAERAADALNDDCDAILEVGIAYSANQRPHTLKLKREWFDAHAVEE